MNPEEDSYYDLPARSSESGEPVRALRARDRARRCAFGEHGLPLIGSRRLERRHEPGRRSRARAKASGSPSSCYDVLDALRRRSRAAAATRRFAERCRREAAELRANIEQHGWDGEWYRRAYFDDGTPLGSAGNAECQIDSIAQSWSVLSGAGDAERSRAAMEALDRRLVRRDARPDPAARSAVRQVGPRIPATSRATCPACGRTAASTRTRAIWAAMAFAALGDSARAWELLRHDQSRSTMRAVRGGDRHLQGRAVRGRGRRLCASRRTPAAAAGPGTPARPAGCTG